MSAMLLLTWTPIAPVSAPRVTSARIYRTAADKWMVLIRDVAYDGARTKYVSQRDFEMLCDAEAFALSQTGKPARVSL